ncbi:tRNA splicing endonuclease subunit sen2 [Drechslerella dactyloides]|uniref:tRNA-splicing endonuclease subunit Sen2 n=1 Tax=Drechslerella dactyloides TaxID=74499 RepID=A0AAD6IZV9_DREDA|nr:tRNA splicing endonuclease subunit sen2 [Drechslerella dactyloides]
MADSTPQGDAAVAAAAVVSHPAASSKPKRPNYAVIHADPVPVALYHSPPLIPHNPLSLLHHLYLYLFPPVSSHQTAYTGVFSPVTMSVEIRDPQAVLDLWQKGFWGKGSLSRSEPTWLNRELRRLGDTEVGATSEEITRQRRDQRKEMKKERARKEREELQKVKAAEAKGKTSNGSTSNGKPVVADAKVVVDLEEEINGLKDLVGGSLKSSAQTGLPTPPLSAADDVETQDTEPAAATSLPDDATPSPAKQSQATGTTATPSQPTTAVEAPAAKETITPKKITLENREHLQLTFQEAFFLAYALGVLSIRSGPDESPLSLPTILRLFLRYSSFPPLPESSISLSNLNPDNRFLINYVAYHHFRSLGWVVKSGVKFSVDYLLYKRGPVFSHAEFAVLVIPSYSRWEGRTEACREWDWLHSITRVNSQVKKTVVLAYVDVPTAEDVKGWEKEADGLKGVFAKYKIREVALRRWIPGRNRD